MLQTNYRSIMTYVIVLIALVPLLTACNDSDSDPAPGPKPLDTSVLNGIWGGEYGDNDATIIFLLRDGEIFALTWDEGDVTAYHGTYTYSDPDTFSTNIKNSEVTVEINGTAAVGGQMEVAYTSSNGNKGDVNLKFSDDQYNRESSFDLYSGEWDSEVTNYSFDSEGGLTASQDECQANGNISIIDPEINLYVFDVDLTECGEDEGQYNGLTYLYDTEAGPNQAFVAIACNEDTDRCLGLGADKK